MLSLKKPSADSIRRFREAQSKRELTYDAIGATETQPPPGFRLDHTRVKLGDGEQVFVAGVAAFRRWEQFQLGWLEPGCTSVPVESGQPVVMLVRVFGIWWMNACRIVYVVEDTGHVTRFGFAYGTLPAHAGSGEERFLIEWHRGDDSVWYDIRAFSRPRHVLARIGYPLMRRVQQRFGRESAAAMQRAVATVVR